MKQTFAFAAIILLLFSGMPCLAAPLGTAARTVIPVEVQQIINVDYRRMKNSDTAMAMKAKLLPPNMKQFEDALKGIGVVPDRDLETITLASFRTKDKISAKKINDTPVYPMSGGMQMVFLDDYTMVFGESSAVQAALDARDDSSQSLNANREVTDMIASVETGTVWSVLDSAGTQAMLKSALGTASNLAEYDTVKKAVLGSRYSVDFDRGVDFNLNVVTSDSMTAATLSSVLKAGMLFKKMSASAIEKTAIEDTTVDSDAGRLVVHFKADDKSFQTLLDAPMFAAVTH